MKYGSVCSGIEAASVAWEPLGWAPSFFSEIEKFPAAVLDVHYPGIPNLGDLTEHRKWDHEPIDLLVGGTPCQSFSVAGLRAGLDDPRGNLTLEFLDLAQRSRPRWLVWENVPGVLSSNEGRDFGSIVGALGQLGYGWAYRVLDAQFIRVDGYARAVPQRRRRVFVVGHLGDWRRAAAVLFERESLSGHPPPRREAGKGVARTLGARPTCGGGLGIDFDLDGGLVTQYPPPVSPSLKARDSKGPSSDGDGDGAPIIPVAHTLRANFDASEDGTGRGTPIVPVAGTMKSLANSGGWSNSVDHAAGGYMIPIVFDCKGTEVQYSEDGSHPTLRSMGRHNSPQSAGGHAAVAFDLRGRDGGSHMEGPHDTANIRAASGGSSRSYVTTSYAVRRLTPVECERLQGFPDNYTNIPWRKKNDAPDGPRYKALGNSMAVNVMRWIGQRIEMVEALEASA